MADVPGTILVADDSPMIQNKAKGILTGEGFDVVTVSNGVAAIKKISQVSPLVILADVSMPGKDGYEVCEFVKNSPALRHVPVLLVVSDMEDYNQERASQVRADGFIHKKATKTPFDPEELIASVAKLVAQSETSPLKSELHATGGSPPASSVVTEPVDEEPAASPGRRTFDFGPFKDEMAFTELPSGATPSAWHEHAPLATERPTILNKPAEPSLVVSAPTVRSGEHSEVSGAGVAPPASEPVLIDEPPGEVSKRPVAAPEPPATERTMMFRMPAEIAEPVLTDDVNPRPPAPPIVNRGSDTAPVAASSLEDFSRGETTGGQIRFASPEAEVIPDYNLPEGAENAPEVELVEEPPEATVESAKSAWEGARGSTAPEVPAVTLDHALLYRIVQKVVTKMSPAAIPLEVIDQMVRRIASEIAVEFEEESRRDQ